MDKNALASSSITNIYSVKTVKLNKNNYAIWRQQVAVILRGSGLLGHVDGTSQMPSPIPNSQGKFIKNAQGLDHEDWIQQDSMLMGWLMTSMTEEVLPKVCVCTTSADMWSTLAKVFASTSQVRTLQLRLTLQTTKKGDKSMEDYISQMVQIANSLALAGDKVQDKDLALFILGGLGIEYDGLVTTITTRPEHISPICR